MHHSSTSAAQGNRLTQDVVKTLLKDRAGSLCSPFWAWILHGKTTEIQTSEDPTIPKKEKPPVKHEFGEKDTNHFLKTPQRPLQTNLL